MADILHSTFLILLQNGLVMLLAREFEDKSYQNLVLLFAKKHPNVINVGTDGNNDSIKEKVEASVKIIDKISFVLCCTIFVLFSIGFWIYYTC